MVVMAFELITVERWPQCLLLGGLWAESCMSGPAQAPVPTGSELATPSCIPVGVGDSSSLHFHACMYTHNRLPSVIQYAQTG